MDTLASPSHGPCSVRRGGTLLLLGMFALSACRSVDAKVWNLRQVHDPEGNTRRTGRLRTDLQQLVISGVQFSENSQANIFGLEEGKEKAIEDPDGVSLENLIELAEFDSDNPRTLALQVEMFGWLGVDDRYSLARERALLELGPLGRKLEVTTPVRRPPGTAAAGAPEVGEALQRLVQTVAPAVRGVAPVVTADVDEACAAIDALVLDRNGLRRLISAITSLLYDGKAAPQELGILPELHRSLLRAFVAQSVAEALGDPNPWVRAAAIEAAVVASDNTLPGLLQGALVQDPTETVRMRCLGLLEKHGIPRAPEDLPAEDQKTYEEDWIGLLVQLLRSSLEGSVTAAACRTLGALSGAPLETLRPEEWMEWWEESHPGGSS